jgi:hypothetical protein
MGQPLDALFPTAAGLVQAVARDAAPVSRSAVPRAAGPGTAATWWDLDIVPHPEIDDVVLVTAREATDRVLARREAEDARDALEPIGSRLRLVQEATGIGTWEWNAAADRLAWSPESIQSCGVHYAANATASLPFAG